MNREDIVKTLSGRDDSPLDSYRNLVNQPTWVDNVGDAFIDQGKGPALNKNQKLENAMMSGFGHGMKGGANSARAAKLAGLEESAKQIAMLDASFKTSLGKKEAKQMAFQNFAIDNFVDFRKANEARAMGDEPAFNDIMGNMFARFSRENPDATKGMVYDHAYGDNSYFRAPDGKTQGINNKDILMPFISTLPEEMQRELPNLMSSTAKTKFEKADLFQNLSLEEKRAGIANQYSQANQHNASAESTRQEMNNPVDDNAQKLDLEIKKDRAVKNYTAVEKEMLPRLNANENVLGVYEAIEDIRKNNPSIVGSDYYTQAKRALATNLGLSADIDYANLKSIEFEKMLKPILGAQLGEKEGERVLSKFISLKQNPAAIDKFLLEEKPRIIKDIVRDKQKIAHYDKENHANLYSENIHSNIDQEVQNYSKTRGKTVTMIAPDGSTREVPKEQAKLWESRGARLTE